VNIAKRWSQPPFPEKLWATRSVPGICPWASGKTIHDYGPFFVAVSDGDGTDGHLENPIGLERSDQLLVHFLMSPNLGFSICLKIFDWFLIIFKSFFVWDMKTCWSVEFLRLRGDLRRMPQLSEMKSINALNLELGTPSSRSPRKPRKGRTPNQDLTNQLMGIYPIWTTTMRISPMDSGDVDGRLEGLVQNVDISQPYWIIMGHNWWISIGYNQ
jgi:hypothetical protein